MPPAEDFASSPNAETNSGASPSGDSTGASLAAPTSSPDANTSSAPASAGSPQSGETTASPPDAPTDDRAGLLAAVRKVIQADPKTPLQGEGTQAAPGETGSPRQVADPNANPQDALEADPSDAELKAFVPRTRARVEKLLSQRNAARTELEALKPDAAKWQQMHGYLSRHDLAAEDVNLLLGVGAALRRGDFKAFLDGVMPYVQLANEAIGNALPPDLQAKVDAGEVTPEVAKELITARHANARLQGTARAATEAAQSAARQEENTRIATTVTAAVNAWEQNVQSRDPDYSKKAATVLRVSQALMSEFGRPRTADEAVMLANRAYEETNRMFAGLTPAPMPTKTSPVGVHAVNGARPEPKTLMEAAMLGLERSRRLN